jgi:thiamine biosynthesis lipoprotein
MIALALTAWTPTESTRWVMGTSLRVVGDGINPALMDSIFAIATGWDERLSLYREDSELSRILLAEGDDVPVSIELIRYLDRARGDWRRTDGVFDILHASDLRGEEAWSLLQWDVSRIVASAAPGLRIDSGGDGKGVAVDDMVARLRDAGVGRALVDFGGSSWAGIGAPPDEEAWRIEVVDESGGPLGWVSFVDEAVSISQTRLRGDDSRAHIVDPRNGEVVRATRTAIVVASTATDAEVLSTSLIVEGKAGMRWLGRFEGARAILIDAEGITPREGATWFRPVPPPRR